MFSKFRIYFFVSFTLLVLFACKEKKHKAPVTFSLHSRIQHAKNFQLISKSTYTELQILDPEKGKVERRYALVSARQITQIPSDIPYIQVPIQGLICLSATPIGMLHKLHAASLVKGVTNAKYIWNPWILREMKAKKVVSFTSIDQLNPEKVLQTGAKLLVFDGFGSYPSIEDKLQKLGVICLPNYDWRENDPLGKAEWIKLFGVLTGRENRALNYFHHASEEYSRLKKLIKASKNHPKLLAGAMIGDMWYMPAGESFAANMYRDAQFDYVEKKSKGTGSVSFSMEHCLKHHQQASIWLDPGVDTYKALLRLSPNYRFFKAYRTKEIYSYTHNANYYWENSASEPHHILSDYMHIQKGLASTKKLYFYRKLQE